MSSSSITEGGQMDSYNEMLNYINGIKIIDVHEHLSNDKLRILRYKDYISLVFSNYICTNAIASGIPEADIVFLQTDQKLDEKYPVYQKACKNIRNTTSFRCLDYAFEKLYGMSILDENYQELNRRFCEKNREGIAYQILKEMNVEWAVNDVFDQSMQNTDYIMDERIFRSSVRCDKYIMINEFLPGIEEEFGVQIKSIEQFCEILQEFIQAQKEKYHAVSLKIATAYYRSLYFEDVDKQTAAKVFSEMLISRTNGQELAFEKVKPLSDYITHFIIKEADKHNLPIQIHTGIQDRNINKLDNAHPLKLNNLFEMYPRVTFVLFHAGYPFGREAGVLAKMFVNVYVDFSWVHILSPKYAVNLMEEYFELIPANKFCGFGGDFCNVEGSFGHLQIAKQNIAAAISEMIDRGWYSAEYGKELARQILYDNPKAIYGI